MIVNRRSFLSIAGFAGIGAWLERHGVRARGAAVHSNSLSAAHRSHGYATAPHPTPRPGITGAKVMTAAQLAKSAYLIPLFDGIRGIPQIADGIRCGCGCAELPGYYSLLSCFEAPDAMATICPICQGAGKLTVRLHGEGQTLAQIRVAVDAQFG